MQSAQSATDVFYPESDGKPMAESELHQDWMFRIRQILKWRHRGQRVYVGCNLLVYFERGNPRRSVAPDVFVALDLEPHRRRTYKTWEEGRPPDVVFEVTSESTRREDEVSKMRTYAEIGVREYFLYDPTADYLDPPLQGFQLENGAYQRLLPDAAGALTSRLLNATLRLEDGELAMFDALSGETLLTEAEAIEKERQKAELKQRKSERKRKEADLKRKEAERQRQEAERQRQEAERQRQEAELKEQQAIAQAAAEKAAREAAEAQLAQLQAELAKLRGPADPQ